MAETYRNEQRTNFTQVSNAFLRDPSISLRAKGLLCLLLSHSGTWTLNNKVEIRDHVKESKDVYYKTLQELRAAGYVVYTVQKDEQGKIVGHHYRYSDERLVKPLPENPEVDIKDIKNTNSKNTLNNTYRPNPEVLSRHDLGDGTRVVVTAPKGTYVPSDKPRAKRGSGKVELLSATKNADGSIARRYRDKLRAQADALDTQASG